MIAGLEGISDGQISIGDRVVNNSPAERDIAMVFQNYALYPHKRLRRIWRFPCAKRDDKAEIKARVERGRGFGLNALPAALSGR